MTGTVRDATVEDAAACAAVYAPYVADTAITFEYDPPTAELMAQRINEASAGLHAALGFQPIGVQRRIGWKHGAWHDVALVQRPLGTDDGPPVEVR